MKEEDLLNRLGKLTDQAVAELGVSKKEVCQTLGLDSVKNWGRDVSTGNKFEGVLNLYRFYQLTKIEEAKDILAEAFNIDWSDHDLSTPSIAQQSPELEAENTRLKQELAEHKKLLGELGADLKKNLNHLTDFTFKKALS